MFIAYVVVAILGALMVTMSASLKLRHDKRVLATIHEVVGVPLAWFPWLAGAELAGAAGLLVGIAWAPLGVAAAAGLVAYFVGAIASHVRVGDFGGLAAPVVPLAVAIAALVTRLLSL